MGQNFGAGQQWQFYYLYGLERAGRLAGIRFFGQHDWYRLGAEELVHDQDKTDGFWRGQLVENDPVLATSFALLFLAKGRAPVLINKLRHGPSGDWNNDPDDIRNIVGSSPATGITCSPGRSSIPHVAPFPRLLQAPIIFFNGHEAPEFTAAGTTEPPRLCRARRLHLRRCLLRQAGIRPRLQAAHERALPRGGLYSSVRSPRIIRSGAAKHLLNPGRHPLWGIEHGCRTVVIYSPERPLLLLEPVRNAARRTRGDQGHEGRPERHRLRDRPRMPADKLTVREVRDLKAEPPKRGALRIAKLMHAGDWNIARQAIPNLMDALRKPPFNFDVVITQKDLFPRDPNLVYYPLIYIHGRAALSFPKEDLEALRSHIDPGGGTLFADAACGSPAFDASFRRFVAELLPNNPLVPIPRDDDLYTTKVGADLSKVQYTNAAGGGVDFPQLEGVKLTAAGSSSIPRTILAAHSNGTPASSAKATPMRAP